jgi:alkylhydroperoxidase family enzyme
VLADYRTAPISDRLRAALVFIEKMTLHPDQLGPEDVRAALAAGVSRTALVDAVHVCANFSIIVRIADAFAFHVQTDAEFLASARQLLKRGYR